MRVRLGDVLGPNGCRQAVSGVVRALDHFVDRLEWNDAHHGAEDLFPGDLHVVIDVGEDRRLHEVTAVADAVTAAEQGAPSFRPASM